MIRVLREWYVNECEPGNWLEVTILFIIKVMKIKLWR